MNTRQNDLRPKQNSNNESTNELKQQRGSFIMHCKKFFKSVQRGNNWRGATLNRFFYIYTYNHRSIRGCRQLQREALLLESWSLRNPSVHTSSSRALTGTFEGLHLSVSAERAAHIWHSQTVWNIPHLTHTRTVSESDRHFLSSDEVSHSSTFTSSPNNNNSL